MAKITALKLQKRNRNRVNVYLEGDYAFGLARVVAGWLQVGQELSPEKIADLQAKDELEIAYQLALKYLSYRERSSSEVRRYLNGRGLEEELIDSVVARLERSQLVDDRRFARAWVGNRTEFRPRSRRALAFELAQKGVPGDAIDSALAGVSDEAQAEKLAWKQARRYRDLPWEEFRRKMVAYLSRRGFNYEVASAATGKAWALNATVSPDTESQTEEVDQ